MGKVIKAMVNRKKSKFDSLSIAMIKTLGNNRNMKTQWNAIEETHKTQLHSIFWPIPQRNAKGYQKRYKHQNREPVAC